MRAQQLEYIRIKLRAALFDGSGKTKGQLQAFSENPPADKGIHPRKPAHFIEFDDGRRVESQNSALYVMETRSRRRPLPPINDNVFNYCMWRRAVLTLEEGPQAWLRYCYGFDLSFSLQTAICKFIWEVFETKYCHKKQQKRVKLRLIALVWLAVQDVAAKNNNESFKEYAATSLAEMLSVHRDTWYQTYAEPWKIFKTIAQNLDESSLSEVLSEVSRIEGESDIEKPDTLCHI